MRTKRVEIRLSEEEYEELMSKKSRVRLAQWMREYCLGAKDVRMVKIDPLFLYELNKIGVNIHQIAKLCNYKKNNVEVLEVLRKLVLIENKLKELLSHVEQAI